MKIGKTIEKKLKFWALDEYFPMIIKKKKVLNGPHGH